MEHHSPRSGNVYNGVSAQDSSRAQFGDINADVYNNITAQQNPKSYFHSLSQAERDAQLLKAIKERQPRRAQLLLDAGANPDATGAQGRSALHLAVSSGQQQCVRMLLDAGANVHARDGAGSSVWSCTKDDTLLAMLGEDGAVELEEDTEGVDNTDGAQTHAKPEKGFSTQSKSAAQESTTSPQDSGTKKIKPTSKSVQHNNWNGPINNNGGNNVFGANYTINGNMQF